ncbi:hypothetical protein AGMMS4957_09240 [Bacteroidia bacterium]|nr:hypothetical protein AGMMS4957_09240 [Bacteroidia bacterium]
MREGENAPVGLILCSEKSPEQINYLLLDNPGQIKVAEYMTQLPNKDLLQKKLQRAIEIASANAEKYTPSNDPASSQKKRAKLLIK